LPRCMSPKETLRRHQTARPPHKSGVSLRLRWSESEQTASSFSLQLLTTWVGLFLPLPPVPSGEAVVGVRAYCR
jgi:hypothetical protein